MTDSISMVQVRQKKYEVLDNKRSLNGVVTITTVTNLQSSNEFNQNQVPPFLSICVLN